MFDFIKGMVSKQKARPKSAREEIEQLLPMYSTLAKMDPLDIMALKVVAVCHFRLQDWEEAVRAFDKVIHIQGNYHAKRIDNRNWAYIAYCYLALGRSAEMQNAWEKASMDSFSEGLVKTNVIDSLPGYISDIWNDCGQVPGILTLGQEIFLPKEQ